RLSGLVEQLRKTDPGGKGAMKVVTACVRGCELTSIEQNQERIELLEEIASHPPDWQPDVILLPGGFFYCPGNIENLQCDGLKRELEEQPFSGACASAAKKTGALVVVGVDGQNSGVGGQNTQQACIAWGSDGIVGIGRKVFPVEGGEANEMLVHVEDFGSSQRLVRIPGKESTALLCACYDIYGCKPNKSNDSRKLSCRGQVEQSPAHERRSQRFLEWVGQGRRGWDRLVGRAGLALSAVHYFSRSGPYSGIGRFGRHGVRGAAKYVGGRLAFAAAHFEQLPRTFDTQCLAAKGGDRLQPTLHFYLDASHSPSSRENREGDDVALVRLFLG